MINTIPLYSRSYCISVLHKINPGSVSFISSSCLFAVTYLGIDEGVVNSLLVEELFVCALLHHHAILKHGDNISILDGGQPVSHYDAGTTLTSLIQGLLYNLHRQRQSVTLMLLNICIGTELLLLWVWVFTLSVLKHHVVNIKAVSIHGA